MRAGRTHRRAIHPARKGRHIFVSQAPTIRGTQHNRKNFRLTAKQKSLKIARPPGPGALKTAPIRLAPFNTHRLGLRAKKRGFRGFKQKCCSRQGLARPTKPLAGRRSYKNLRPSWFWAPRKNSAAQAGVRCFGRSPISTRCAGPLKKSGPWDNIRRARAKVQLSSRVTEPCKSPPSRSAVPERMGRRPTAKTQKNLPAGPFLVAVRDSTQRPGGGPALGPHFSNSVSGFRGRGSFRGGGFPRAIFANSALRVQKPRQLLSKKRKQNHLAGALCEVAPGWGPGCLLRLRFSLSLVTSTSQGRALALPPAALHRRYFSSRAKENPPGPRAPGSLQIPRPHLAAKLQNNGGRAGAAAGFTIPTVSKSEKGILRSIQPGFWVHGRQASKHIATAAGLWAWRWGASYSRAGPRQSSFSFHFSWNVSQQRKESAFSFSVQGIRTCSPISASLRRVGQGPRIRS